MADEEKESGTKGLEFIEKIWLFVFIACVLIGICIGIAYNQMVVGVFIGLGCGLLVSFILRWKGVQS